MNDRFCKNCGNKMDGTANFCKSCGAKTEALQPAQESSARATEHNAAGAMQAKPEAGEKNSKSKAVASDIVSTAVFASETAGAMVFRQDAGGVAEILGPLQVIIQAVGDLFGKIKGAFKEKKRIVPIIMITLIWLVLILLPMLGIDSGIFRFLSFLTFAQGGMSGGILGLVGGIIGKGVFAYFIFSIVIPLISGKNPLKGIGGTFKELFSQFSIKSSGQVAGLLLGAGAALVAYNFFVGSASLQNSMVGAAAFFVALRTFSSRTGFVRRLVSSVSTKFSGGKRADLSFVNRFGAGLSTGFALAVPLSALPGGALPYLCGAVCAVVGAVLIFIARGSGKEAHAI